MIVHAFMIEPDQLDLIDIPEEEKICEILLY